MAAAAGRPLLPAPTSWYPGHMTLFTRMLPALLRRTDVVLELRDSRLPLTSINPNFEGVCFLFLCFRFVGLEFVGGFRESRIFSVVAWRGACIRTLRLLGAEVICIMACLRLRLLAALQPGAQGITGGCYLGWP